MAEPSGVAFGAIVLLQMPRLLVLLAYVAVPGLAVLRAARFSSQDRQDVPLALFGVGLASTGLAVYALLLAGAYVPATAFLILLVPGAYLVALALKRDTPLGELLRAARLSLVPRGPVTIHHAALAGCLLLVLVTLPDALTSPITWWDGYISWDKWATDWARRRHLYGYMTGYPQLLPMFSSVLYKLTGAWSEVLPLEQFALHGMHTVFALALVAGLWRLAALAPAPPALVLLSLFGCATARDQILGGSADVLVTTLTVAAVALHLGHLHGRWTARGGVVFVVGPILFAAVFTKPTGALAILLIAALELQARVRPGLLEPARRTSWKTLAATLVIPLVLCAPYYASQVYVQLRVPPSRLDPYELNFPVLRMADALRTHSAASLGGGGSPARWTAALDRVLSTFAVPRALHLPLLAAATAVGVAALRRRRGAALLVPAVAFVLAWSRWFAYDVRNLLPGLPFLLVGLAQAGRGGPAPSKGHSRFLTTALFGAALAGALFAIPAASALVGEVASRLSLFGRMGEATRRGRVEAMTGDERARIGTFFPGEFPDYLLVKRLRVPPGSKVIAPYPLYRWFRRGAYPISVWPASHLRPGDVYVGSPEFVPGGLAGWHRLHEDARMAVLVFTPGLKSVPLDALVTGGAAVRSLPGRGVVDLRGNASRGLLGYEVPSASAAPGARVLWRATGCRDVAQDVRPDFRAEPAEAVLHRSVFLHTHAKGGAAPVYTGLVPLSARAAGARLVVGVAGGPPADRLCIAEFSVSTLPAPPSPPPGS